MEKFLPSTPWVSLVSEGMIGAVVTRGDTTGELKWLLGQLFLGNGWESRRPCIVVPELAFLSDRSLLGNDPHRRERLGALRIQDRSLLKHSCDRYG